MNARVRFVFVSTLIVIGLLLLIGATYQGVATALERRRYPHPGRLVDVGGHQLHIFCLGDGSPTVVFEAPAASMSAAWGWVQGDVAKTTRACTYDRAGLGWSEAGDKPYDPGRVPEELRALLTASGQPGPYVLVGYSLGASFVRRFATLYPQDTAAIVLVEEDDQRERSTKFMTMAPWLARTGVLRATGLLSDRWDGLPPADAAVMSAFLHRPDHLTRSAREVVREGDARRLADAAARPTQVRTARVRADLHDQARAHRVTDVVVAVVNASRRLK
jgi:pimeloyl-ACP methyl ester carboxylesterase